MEIRLYEFTTGIETGTQPDAGTPSLANDIVTKGYVDGAFASLDRYRSGGTTLTTSDTQKAVSFNTNLASANYSISISFKNTVEGTAAPSISYEVIAQADSGFTIYFYEPIQNNNTTMLWTAWLYNNP